MFSINRPGQIEIDNSHIHWNSVEVDCVNCNNLQYIFFYQTEKNVFANQTHYSMLVPCSSPLQISDSVVWSRPLSPVGNDLYHGCNTSGMTSWKQRLANLF